MRELTGKGRAQSAMEYLMTYGWAILVIAVVLGVLFELGVFNPANLGPRAQPGSCHVYRPNGPGTSLLLNLEGVCNGALPEYAASFNGNNQYIYSNVTGMPTGNSSRTVTAWFSDSDVSPRLTLFWYGATTCSNPSVPPRFFQIYIQSGGIIMNAWCTDQGIYGNPQQNVWYFVAYEYNKSAQEQIGYVGAAGEMYSASSITYNSYNTTPTPFYMGNGNGGGYFAGMESNVQIYNTTLSSNTIQSLYQEGIGGAPTDLKNLVAWYPLNGNAQDYSGNNNNGQEVNGATFTSQWMNGYTAP